jgi:hypothetical protein
VPHAPHLNELPKRRQQPLVVRTGPSITHGGGVATTPADVAEQGLSLPSWQVAMEGLGDNVHEERERLEGGGWPKEEVVLWGKEIRMLEN